VSPVKWLDLEMGEYIPIQTTNIHVITIRVRSGAVKRMNTTDLTEQMFGNPGIEGISFKGRFPTQQLKLGGRHNQVQKSFFLADRAVAVGNNLSIGNVGNPEAHCSTVAPTLVGHQRTVYHVGKN
jgi:hypothetical protein